MTTLDPWIWLRIFSDASKCRGVEVVVVVIGVVVDAIPAGPVPVLPVLPVPVSVPVQRRRY